MTTPNLQLPEVPEAIQEASDEINAGFLRLDAVVQLAVLAKDVASPPASPVQGDRYIVPIGASGLWSGRDRSIAFRGPAGWLYYVPRPGWRARVLDEDEWYVFIGTAWQIDSGGGAGGIITRGATWVRSNGNAIALPVVSPSFRVPVDGSIIRAVLLTEGGSGSCVVDVRKDILANYPPTGIDSICGASKPTLSSSTVMVDETLTGWTPAVLAGDIVRCVLESSSNFTAIYFSLDIEPTP